MMLVHEGHRRQVVHRILAEPHAALGRPGFRKVDATKLPAKHLNCKTCDGKACLGHCRFEKLV